MKKPQRKTLRAERDTLVTYEDAFALMRARGICTTMRTVKAHIHAHPEICPFDKTNQSYHFKRFKLGHVEALVEHLAKKYPARTACATVTAPAVTAVIDFDAVKRFKTHIVPIKKPTPEQAKQLAKMKPITRLSVSGSIQRRGKDTQ